MKKRLLRKMIAMMLSVVLGMSLLQAVSAETMNEPLITEAVVNTAVSQDDTIKILMVGNSLTRYNSVADKLEQLFAYAGKQATVDTRTQMGASLIDQAEILATSTREAIVHGDYDYVVLQEKSSGFTESLLMQGAAAFDPWIQEAASQPQLVLYMPWSNEDVFKTMQTTFTNAYVKVAKEYGALLAPSGEAYYDMYFNEGKKWYRNGDNVHGNDLASLISASTLFYTMSGQAQPVLQIREEDQSVVKALVESSDYRNYPVQYDRDLVNLIERKAYAFANTYRDLDHVPDLTGRGIDATVNLAKQKQGSASSNARGATRGIGARNVANLTDGSYTSFITLHEEDPDPWFAVDLGVKMSFNQLNLYWGATGEYADSYKAKFTIEGTNDPNAGYQVIKTGESTSTNKQEIRFPGVEYQYVRVHVTEKSGAYASLYEMEIYNLPAQDDSDDPGTDIEVKVGDYLQVQVGDSHTNMSLYEMGIYEAEVAFPQGVKDYKILSNGESIFKGTITESIAAQNVIIRLFAADDKVVTGQDVHKDVNGNPVQAIKKVANWTGNFFNRTGIEEFKAFGGWDQASPLSTLYYLGGGIFARELTYTVPKAAVSYDYKINFDRTWNNGEVPSGNRNVVFPASEKETDKFVLWVNSVTGDMFDSINDGSTTFKLQDNDEYRKAIGTAKVELSLSKDRIESFYPMVQTRKNTYMVTAFIEPGTYTWADQIDEQDGTLSGSFTVAKDTAVTFYYRVHADDYVMLNSVDHAEELFEATNPDMGNEAIPVETIHVRGNDTITSKGGTLQLTAEVLPADATNKAVTWSVENGTGSATINALGLLTAVSDGVVTVKATAADGSGMVGTKSITISGQTTSNPGTNNPGTATPAPTTTPAPTATPAPSATPTTTPIPSSTPAPTSTPTVSKPVFNDKVNVEVVKRIMQKENAAPAVNFTDVPASSWSARAVERAAKMGIVSGYNDGSYRPAEKVTRAEFAVMLTKAFGLTVSSGSSFSDMQGHWASGATAALRANGIVAGYGDGSFRPDQEITRAEIVAMLARLTNYVPSASNSFPDVVPNWASDQINALAAAGIVSGSGNGMFKPNDAASRAEAVAMIVRMLDKLLAP